MIETEAKIELFDAAERTKLVTCLGAMGFRVAERVYERNVLYDTPDRRLTKAGEILRIRSRGPFAYMTNKEDSKTIVTHKKKNEGEIFPHRREFEFEAPQQLKGLLQLLGYEEVFRYERWRTIYKPYNHKVGGEVCIDDFTRVDMTENNRVFVEFEGWDTWISDMLFQTDFAKSRIIPHSYREIFNQ